MFNMTLTTVTQIILRMIIPDTWLCLEQYFSTLAAYQAKAGSFQKY